MATSDVRVVQEKLKPILGSDKRIFDWLRSNNPDLNNKMPIEIILRGGVERVLKIVQGMETRDL